LAKPDLDDGVPGFPIRCVGWRKRPNGDLHWDGEGVWDGEEWEWNQWLCKQASDGAGIMRPFYQKLKLVGEEWQRDGSGTWDQPLGIAKPIFPSGGETSHSYSE